MEEDTVEEDDDLVLPGMNELDEEDDFLLPEVEETADEDDDLLPGMEEDAIKCWKYKKSLKGHNKYEDSDLIALKDI